MDELDVGWVVPDVLQRLSGSIFNKFREVVFAGEPILDAEHPQVHVLVGCCSSEVILLHIGRLGVRGLAALIGEVSHFLLKIFELLLVLISFVKHL